MTDWHVQVSVTKDRLDLDGKPTAQLASDAWHSAIGGISRKIGIVPLKVMLTDWEYIAKHEYWVEIRFNFAVIGILDIAALEKTHA